jgi:hypothetical protein
MRLHKFLEIEGLAAGHAGGAVSELLGWALFRPKEPNGDKKRPMQIKFPCKGRLWLSATADGWQTFYA